MKFIILPLLTLALLGCSSEIQFQRAPTSQQIYDLGVEDAHRIDQKQFDILYHIIDSLGNIIFYEDLKSSLHDSGFYKMHIER